MRILAISGSLRRESHNTQLLRTAATLLPSGVELEIWDGLKQIPPFDQDDEGEPGAAVEELRAAVRAADAVLIATPEYNGSIPGQLKNALDWLSRPFATNALRNKPVAVVGASTGMFGAVWSQAEARRVLGLIGARVIDVELPVPQAHEQFHPDGRLRDDQLVEQLQGLLLVLCGYPEDEADDAVAAAERTPVAA